MSKEMLIIIRDDIQRVINELPDLEREFSNNRDITIGVSDSACALSNLLYAVNDQLFTEK